MTFGSCLNRLKATAISTDKACYVLLLVYWKDVAIGFIRVEAYPDMRIIRVEALTIFAATLDKVDDWEKEVDLLMSCAYAAYRGILRASPDDWTIEVQNPYGWTPQRTDAHIIIMRNIQLPTEVLFTHAVFHEIQKLEETRVIPIGGATDEGRIVYVEGVRRFASRVAKTLFGDERDVGYRSSLHVYFSARQKRPDFFDITELARTMGSK